MPATSARRARLLLLLVGAGAGCAPADPPPVLGEQPPVQAFLVLHVDPMAREVGDCEEQGLGTCGPPVAASFEQRTRNLRWLADRWIAQERAVDLQLGPELSLSWMEDPEVAALLAADFAAQGDADGQTLPGSEAEARVAAVAAEGRGALGDLLQAGAGSLGMHVHSVLPDENGFGDAPRGGGQGDAACGAWEQAPLEEVSPEVVDAVVAWGLEAATPLAEALDAPLVTFTGHLPRTLEGKRAVVEDPASLGPAVAAALTDRFQPVDLGSAYSECLLALADHPPFERWPAHAHEALGAGDGPPITPGERAVGTMTEHLGAPTDTSAPAAARRLLQLLLNWRAAAIRGDAPRSWTWTFHSHLFLLDPGTPAARQPDARVPKFRDHNKLREDLDALSGLVDAFAARGSFAGAAGEGGAVVDWRLPAELDPPAEGGFDLSTPGAAPVTDPAEALDPARYPYLPLVAERLADSHLACTGATDEVEVWGFERCPAGWAWGGDAAGLHCADGAAPEPVFVLLSPEEACVEGPGGLVRAAALDAAEAGAPDWCDGDGLVVPPVGLLVEPAAGGWLSDICRPWR